MEILLIQRGNPPYKDCWALPGGFIDRDEDALTAAKRELLEETGLRCSTLTPFGAYSDPDRDPRGRVITVSFYTFLNSSSQIAKAGDDAKSLKWWPIRRLPPLAFDHDLMIKDLMKTLKTQVQTDS